MLTKMIASGRMFYEERYFAEYRFIYPFLKGLIGRRSDIIGCTLWYKN